MECIRLILLLVFLQFSAGAFSGVPFSHDATITKITTYANGGIYIYVDAPHQCGSNMIGVLNSTETGFKMIYSALLSYEAQGKKIRFGLSECDIIPNTSTAFLTAIESAP